MSAVEPEPRSFEIVVVGGGPAGGAAAIVAAEAGMRVAVVDDANGWDGPGETLHPGVEVVLRRLGVLEAVTAAAEIRPDGLYVAWGVPIRHQRYGGEPKGPWLGFQVPRAVLRDILIARARSLGATVLQPARATGFECGGYVSTTLGPLRGAIIIDASGGRGWLAKITGQLPIAVSQPLVARYGWSEPPSAARFARPRLEGDRSGWTYIAQVSARRCAWVTLGIPPADWRRRAPAELAAHRIARDRGAAVTWTRAATFAGEGYFRVGDAAMRLDPSSSHGVLRALITGSAAASAAMKSLSIPSSAAGRRRAFSEWMTWWFRCDVEAMAEQYAVVGVDILLGNR